jgi:myo-inositol-1(or 4)-monophosphatase
MRETVVELARALRERVLPELGSHAGREHANTGKGGDVTFAIDEMAESFMEEHLAREAPGVAFYSEDRGMVTPSGEPEWVLIVDPIDGTRPAMAGFEAACVSVAAARLDDEPTLADVEVGCVIEIKSGAEFVAERGGGMEPAPKLSANTDVTKMFWAYGLRGRPVRVIAEVIADVVDASSVGGGTFDLGSATYDLTRLVTGQLDAYIEPGPRIVADVPGMREAFEELGGGAVLNNSPYDLAAVVLICQEGGAVVTDAYGVPLGPQRLLGSGAEFQISCLAASTQELHVEICRRIEAGMERLHTDRR